ncbi:hypothetical protein [Salmonella phage SE131]|uniref:Uncharacterized protein n=1 Tax=Salmonella phage SE131 TaxID=2081631 RepID=A0A2P1CA97_9CAUD|nr:hypothetical protein PQC35_gp141 [Salmonella phage SE131]AVJ48158.1 hypothetical protein [Salmonella phage SE131]
MITLWQTRKMLIKRNTISMGEAYVIHRREMVYYRNLLKFYGIWNYGTESWYKAKESFLIHRDRVDEINNSAR